MLPFTWSLPYPSQREPVVAERIVATSQPLAAQAGLQMLLRGGTAADAAIATAAALTVLEPTSNGIGSDAFALVAWKGRVIGLNASGRAPKAADPARLAPWRGAGARPRLGWDWATVPGCVSGWVALSKRFGRLPFGDLLEPAIRYARNGFPVAPQTATGWARAVARFADRDGLRFEEFRRVFLPGGRAPQPGEIVTLPDHAATLEEIARTSGDSFYRGRIGMAIAAAARQDGAAMAEQDLADHRADWVEPISIGYRGFTLHEIPPNGQGIAALLALGALRERDLPSLQPDCPDALHASIEAMKLAFADVNAEVADPAAMRTTAAALLDPARLAARAAQIDPARAGDPGHGAAKPGGTVLLVAADADGMMVSFIQSNYEGFGSGVVVPGTGVALQNRGAGFSLEPGHPNEFAGGKRPYHTIIPALVTRGDGPSPAAAPLPAEPAAAGKGESAGAVAAGPPFMAFGVMGGFMQPQGHVQVLSRIVDFGQNPQAALDAPRWQVMAGRRVTIEPGFEPALYDELRQRGHELEVAERRSVAFGGGQAVVRIGERAYLGASDPRRDGGAVGA